MVESLITPSPPSPMASPSFASAVSTSSSSSITAIASEHELLEMRIAETRAQLQALREEGCRQRLEHAQQYQTLQSSFDTLHATLTKSSSRLNMFTYTHAMLQAQTTVVQPYILKKQAMLCHAFHHNEVLTKQMQLKQVQADALVAMLEHSKRQVCDFWQARLAQLQANVQEMREECAVWQDRIVQLKRATLSTTLVSSSQSSSLPSSSLSSSSMWARNHEVIIEEDDEGDDDDDDDNMSSSTSSSSQWTEEASPPPQHQHHQHDVLLQVLSMALTAVTEGRLPSVLDMKAVSITTSTPTKKNDQSNNKLRATTTTTTSVLAKAPTPLDHQDAWDNEKSSLRKSLQGLETTF